MRPIRHCLLSLLAAILVLTFAVSVTVQVQAADQPGCISDASKAVRDKIDLKSPQGCSHIFGFNYQPSWGHNGLTVWGEKFDAKRYREELAAGKRYFPKFNAVRIWLSWSAYRENPEQFVRNFQQAVDICGELDLLVLPILFNRWTGNPLWDRVQNREILADFETTFSPFIEAIVTPMKGDLRILAWDLCNEPYLRGAGDEAAPVSPEVETEWLGKVHRAVKQRDPEALICIGTCPSMTHLTRCSHLQDILTPHLYVPLCAQQPIVTNSFEEAKKLGRPMMSTECCWGSPDDAKRVEIIRENLTLLKQYKIAFFPHALWTSGVADLHKYEHGLYMPFILSNGSLRPGHEVYNEFTQ